MKSEAPGHVNNQQSKAWWRSGLTRKTRNLVPSGASVRIRPTSKCQRQAGAFIFPVFPKTSRNLRFRFCDFVCHRLEAEPSRVERTSRSGPRQETSHRRLAGRRCACGTPHVVAESSPGDWLRFSGFSVCSTRPTEQATVELRMTPGSFQQFNCQLQHKASSLCVPFSSCHRIATFRHVVGKQQSASA